jgi:hypothetical protein
VTFRVAFGLANLARTLAPRPYTLEPVDPPPGRPAPALYYHLDRTDWPDAVGAIAELEADLVRAQ